MGHAYYANYLFWFEQARGAWCRDRGFTYKSLEEKGYFLPVVEAHVRYKDEVRYDDDIVVRVRLVESRRSAIKFEYEIFNETTGKLTTTGHTWHVWMGADRKAVPVTDELKSLFLRPPSSASENPPRGDSDTEPTDGRATLSPDLT